MTLSRTQLDTLRNLARKKAGGEVGWVAIAEARALTALGLATRNRSGWEITADGEIALGSQAPEDIGDNGVGVLPFPPRDQAGRL
ncbi:MAG TPA: hypothetical protein VHY32_07785 [Caulobacteraceae bacterium]|nr:hypothetical protein [Caulobacteraceae bacterium]